jgi:DNA polymerase delta subunit 1
LLHVTGFLHYLYVEAPVGFQVADCEKFKTFLDGCVAQSGPAIHSVGLVKRESLYYYKGNQQFAYIKITVTDPGVVANVRGTIERCQANYKKLWKPVLDNEGKGHIQTYDMVDYLTRFMIDCDVSSFLSCVSNVADKM